VAWWAVPYTPGARTVRNRDDGWVEAEVPASRTDSFLSWVLSFGPDVAVLAPHSLRDQVLRRLKALVADG
jgi:predicted DNA-binding transcriptional regulator YafY